MHQMTCSFITTTVAMTSIVMHVAGFVKMIVSCVTPVEVGSTINAQNLPRNKRIGIIKQLISTIVKIVFLKLYPLMQ